MTLKLTGLKKLDVAVRRAPSLVNKELDQGIKKSILVLQRTAMKLVPVDTGILRASHRTRFNHLRGELFPTVKYALWVHEGTRSHIIRAVNKKVLAGKGQVFGKKVNHPGTQNVPWLTATVRSKLTRVELIIQMAITRALIKAFK